MKGAYGGCESMIDDVPIDERLVDKANPYASPQTTPQVETKKRFPWWRDVPASALLAMLFFVVPFLMAIIVALLLPLIQFLRSLLTT